jgi:hypothetical protein
MSERRNQLLITLSRTVCDTVPFVTTFPTSAPDSGPHRRYFPGRIPGGSELKSGGVFGRGMVVRGSGSHILQSFPVLQSGGKLGCVMVYRVVCA